ncbi:MAG: class I SAM-dependent methyltransferase [Halanaeroarchaeum sp.]
MRRFSAAYLRDTRRGLWDDRRALAALSLGDRERILDVGCGSGELTRVLREESDAEVVGIDADRELLAHVADAARVQGDATSLPFADDAFDLVVCQALLINLPDPGIAVREFARVSSDRVAAIEPDNSRVTVDSSVPTEGPLARRAREAYIAGVETDVTLGPSVADHFREAGVRDVETTRHALTRAVSAPYDESDVESAKRKARGTRIEEQRRTLRSGGLSTADVDDLRQAWREMGREVVDQMAAGEYEREAVVPFFVTAGRVD